MVVISVAILSKSGKVLLARPFIPLSRVRLDGYLLTFPKLVNSSEQHTFIDTDHIRYVYQPMENTYVLLITNKSSNIMEDLETLRLLVKLIPEYCEGNSEDHIVHRVYELTMAIDELLTHGGYKENVTLQQIKTFTEMDSHEEKLQKIIMESKMNEARDQARKRAQDIDHAKAAAMRQPNKYSSYSSDDQYETQMQQTKQQSFTPEPTNVPTPKAKPSESSNNANKAKVKGMQLSKAKKTDDFFDQLNKEEKLAPLPVGGRAAVGSAAPMSSAAAAQVITHDHLRILVEEKINVTMDKEGGIKSSEIKGEMKLSIFDPDDSKIYIKTNGPLKENDGFKCRLHPKINKNLWASSGSLGLADAGKGFPVGSDNAPIILKWRKEKLSESDVPFTLNFWPNVENGQSVVSVEYEASKIELNNVVVSIPCPSSDAPDVSNCTGNYHYDARQHVLTWRLASVGPDNNSTGSLEFSVPEIDGEQFFPINIQFTSPHSLSNIDITGVVNAENEKPVEYNCDTQVGVEKYSIE